MTRQTYAICIPCNNNTIIILLFQIGKHEVGIVGPVGTKQNMGLTKETVAAPNAVTFLNDYDDKLKKYLGPIEIFTWASGPNPNLRLILQQ